MKAEKPTWLAKDRTGYSLWCEEPHYNRKEGWFWDPTGTKCLGYLTVDIARHLFSKEAKALRNGKSRKII